ncbi:cytochrome P450 [Coniophora puteana RWD-64-598 SS2]|uniref:Cytochrome P450 n=1 Tax=Coniophora puteana (strain RWD-64-598) TaxID=741705 RepID=A0A5M3MA85_CONPW|nr:cytochrome P450 [Coniophora puteana RWD-64-598 SS2]EIW76168.1 cytochrome P450 [Coniophora puteana RWD-64-598 SS2]
MTKYLKASLATTSHSAFTRSLGIVSGTMLQLSQNSIGLAGAASAAAIAWLSLKLWAIGRQHLHTTRLSGPPRKTFLFGVEDKIDLENLNKNEQTVDWISQYGGIFKLPVSLGMTFLVLSDPVGIAHFFAEDAYTYQLPQLSQISVDALLNAGNLLSAQGDEHKRQRRTLAPAFTNTAIRRLVPAFFSSANKAKAEWEKLCEANPDGAIEVQHWMNCISLDSIGVAGFSYDFGTVEGKDCAVADALKAASSSQLTMTQIAFILASFVFPWLAKLPNPGTASNRQLGESLGAIAKTLLEEGRAGKQDSKSNSLVELLIRSEDADSKNQFSEEEIIAQMKLMVVAGYETTSIALTWALIELSRNQDIQSKLRAELAEFQDADLTWEDLTTRLPYLDAVVHETLRVHPSLTDVIRVATRDDVIPLSKPVKTASGQLQDRISIAKGTSILVPVKATNTSHELWGPDATEFKPERWLSDDPAHLPKDVSGYRHLVTFIEGPKTCIGKAFAVAEMKVVLCVLVRSFVFDLCDGREIKLTLTNGLLPRPKVVGEEGSRVPLRVRRAELN